jgi:hypothetical protein
MKTEIKDENAIKFARALVKQFGRARSKEILNFLLKNKNAIEPNKSEDMARLAALALNYIDPNKEEH